MKKGPLAIVMIINIILIIVIIAILAWIYQSNMHVSEQMHEYDNARMDRMHQIESLEQEVSGLQDELDTAQEALDAQKEDMMVSYRSYGIYSYGGYQFSKPEAWEGVTRDEGIEFRDAEGTAVALMTCPLVETGYEGLILTKDTRTLETDGGDTEVNLWLTDLEAETSTPVSYFHLLTMRPTDPDLSDESCQILGIEGTHNYSEVFTKMFESVRVEE